MGCEICLGILSLEMKDFYPDQLKVHALPKLRADGIWPME